MSESFLNGKVTLHCGDNRSVLASYPDNSFDSIVTDPPYALVSIVKRYKNETPRSNMEDKLRGPALLGGSSPHYARLARGFMGKEWDTGDTAHAIEFWRECYRVLKPGGHVVAFAGTRTYHRLAIAIEDAGFEIRDQLQWMFGSGFPKSHDVSKGIDRADGYWRGRAGPVIERTVGQVAKGTEYERMDKGEPITPEAQQWQGWGTALKPACEPICLARKPLIGTVAENVLAYGTGAINIDGCRIETEELKSRLVTESDNGAVFNNDTCGLRGEFFYDGSKGRWPANVLHDNSDDVLQYFPLDDLGGNPARFFYSSKADADDRLGSKHPTVKPVDLMQWLVRLITPKNGVCLDPFAGTGTTAEACVREGMRCVLIEREEQYQADIRRRMKLIMSGADERRRESIKAKGIDLPFEKGTLFAYAEAQETPCE